MATAKLWAADAGHRIAHTTVHVHGGVGIDLDGEAHRYFTSAKRYEFLHGGATEQALHDRADACGRAGLRRAGGRDGASSCSRERSSCSVSGPRTTTSG